MNIYLIPIVSILLSGVVAALVSAYLTTKYAKRKEKYDALSDILGNRIAMTHHSSEEQREVFFSALNRLILIYDGNSSVVDALRRFQSNPGEDSDSLVLLIEAMCEDLKLKSVSVQDELIRLPFRSNINDNTT